MLNVDKIVSGYGEVPVLHEISFEVGNEVFAVLGANGAGKSTLIKTLAGMRPLKSGSIRFKDQDISGFASYQTANLGIAVVPQEGQIFKKLTVTENLSIGGLHLSKELRKEKFEEVFSLFPEVYERRNQLAGSLSGGEAQMVTFSRALMQNPELILLDEPTAGLSPRNVDIFFQKVYEIRKTKGVSVLVTEQNAMKALEIADRVMVMTLGKVFFIKQACDVDLDIIKEGYRI